MTRYTQLRTKGLALLLTVLCALSALSPLALAADMAYLVTPEEEDRVTLRAKASASADAMGRYFTGTSVTVLGTSGDFTRVTIDTKTGYVESSLLSNTQPGPLALRFATVNNPATGDTLPLLEEASGASRVLAKLPNGTVAYVKGEENGYYAVRTASHTGYLKMDTVQVDGDKGKATLTTLTAGKVTASGSTVVRAYPDRKAPITATVDANAIVEILGNAGPWYYVEANLSDGPDLQRGFILGQYLMVGNYDDSAATQDSARYGIVQNPQETDRLHLRSQPASSGASLGQYLNTTQVLITGEEKDAKGQLWYAVQVDGISGYMLGKYVGLVETSSNASW